MVTNFHTLSVLSHWLQAWGSNLCAAPPPPPRPLSKPANHFHPFGGKGSAFSKQVFFFKRVPPTPPTEQNRATRVRRSGRGRDTGRTLRRPPRREECYQVFRTITNVFFFFFRVALRSRSSSCGPKNLPNKLRKCPFRKRREEKKKNPPRSVDGGVKVNSTERLRSERKKKGGTSASSGMNSFVAILNLISICKRDNCRHMGAIDRRGQSSYFHLYSNPSWQRKNKDVTLERISFNFSNPSTSLKNEVQL